MSAKGKQDGNIQLSGSLEMPGLSFSLHQPGMASSQTEIWGQLCVWIYTHSNRAFLVHLWSTNFYQKGTSHFLPKWGLKNFPAPIMFRQALAISYLTETLMGSSWAINNLQRGEDWLPATKDLAKWNTEMSTEKLLHAFLQMSEEQRETRKQAQAPSYQHPQIVSC